MITATDTGLCEWPDCHRDPYKLVAVGLTGIELVVASGHDPASVRSTHYHIPRNPKIYDRIELRDFDGVIDTIWSRSWI